MEKKEVTVLIIVLLAFVLLAVHQIICAHSGTILRPGNITLAAVLLTVIFAGCLWILSKRNYIGWKQVLLLVFALVFLFVIRIYMFRAEIMRRFTFNQNMILNVLYILLQLIVGIAFYASLKPKGMGANGDKHDSAGK